MSAKNNEVAEAYEEEEVEVTDDEDGAFTEPQGDDEDANIGQPSSSASPGKVRPSEEVKNLKMESPESTANARKNGIPANRNPFTTYGTWTKETFSQIEIAVPILTGKNESTNDLTRTTKPEARYWKAPIVFRYGNYTSTTIRFDNVPIPFHTGKGYGNGYIYLCLPGFAAEKFAEACKAKRPTTVNEKSLMPDKNRWWKVANKVEDSFGIVNGQTNRFQKKNLEVIFDATNSGITASVVLSFVFKASTDSLDPLKPTTTGTIAVELERGFISATDVNVEMPVRVKNTKAKVEAKAVSKDVADDSLMKRLAELGL